LWSKRICPFPSIKVKGCIYVKDCVTDPKAKARDCPLRGTDYFDTPSPKNTAQQRANQLQGL